MILEYFIMGLVLVIGIYGLIFIYSYKKNKYEEHKSTNWEVSSEPSFKEEVSVPEKRYNRNTVGMSFNMIPIAIKVKFKRLVEDAIIPEYKTEGSAGFDFHAVDYDIINPGDMKMINTGLALAVPNHLELQVRPRSGLAAKHRITVLNTPGTIDSDYRGEIKVMLYNHSDEQFVIHKGDGIAQGVLAPVIQAMPVETDELPETERGEGGFGSTGK